MGLKNMLWFLVVAILPWMGCAPKPTEIRYGEDICHFCSMTIVDNQFASQYVTEKGRSFKFDAIECLIKDLADKDEPSMAFVLVSNYSNPGELIDARTARYVVSKSINSPMGANLLAVKNENAVQNVLPEMELTEYDWKEICSELNN